MSKKKDKNVAPKESTQSCVSCGAPVRLTTQADGEQLCLICQARSLNDKFHSLRKRSDEDRARLAASE